MLLNPKLFILPHDEIKTAGHQNLTYGSLTTKGVKKMSETIQSIIPAQIRGFDLGCGDGELIFHLTRSLPESEWEGVEISDCRVSAATRPVIIWAGDMLEENFRPYNVLHADNLCLEDHFADKLEEKIVREFKGLYISYRTPQNMGFLQKATLVNVVEIETTWTKHPIRFYML
jgi:hypothetical protein